VVDFEGRRCYKLRIVRNAGQPDEEFYDVETGLLAGSVILRESPMGAVKATNVLSDYKPFGGVRLATRGVQRQSGVEQVITILTVEHDTVPATAFDPPAEIRTMLQKPAK